MGSDTHIRVSEDVKRKLDRHRRDNESFSDALDRLIDEDRMEQFMAGFGAGAGTDRAATIRAIHERGEADSRAHIQAMAGSDDTSPSTRTSKQMERPRPAADHPLDQESDEGADGDEDENEDKPDTK